jgi:hypothetical protein
MEALIRIIAVIIEVFLLAGVAYAVLSGVRLAALDLGIRAKYSRAVTMGLFAIGFIVLVFFIAHLSTFYPEVR